jgi:hypothetical protein
MNKNFGDEGMVMRVYTLDELMEYVRSRAMKAIARLDVEPGCLAYQLAEVEKRGELEDEYERFFEAVELCRGSYSIAHFRKPETFISSMMGWLITNNRREHPWRLIILGVDRQGNKVLYLYENAWNPQILVKVLKIIFDDLDQYIRRLDTRLQSNNVQQ